METNKQTNKKRLYLTQFSTKLINELFCGLVQKVYFRKILQMLLEVF